MSEIEFREQKVGIVDEYDSARDVFVIRFDSGRFGRYTTEALEVTPYYIGNDMWWVYDSRKKIGVCSECGEDAFYNSKKDDWYCGVCDDGG
jgi:ribosomal protein S27AE